MDDKETARQRWVKKAVDEWHEDVKPTAIAWWTDLLKDWRLHLITAVAVLLLAWSLWPSSAKAQSTKSLTVACAVKDGVNVCVLPEDELDALIAYANAATKKVLEQNKELETMKKVCKAKWA